MWTVLLWARQPLHAPPSGTRNKQGGDIHPSQEGRSSTVGNPVINGTEREPKSLSGSPDKRRRRAGGGSGACLSCPEDRRKEMNRQRQSIRERSTRPQKSTARDGRRYGHRIIPAHGNHQEVPRNHRHLRRIPYPRNREADHSRHPGLNIA